MLGCTEAHRKTVAAKSVEESEWVLWAEVILTDNVKEGRCFFKANRARNYLKAKKIIHWLVLQKRLEVTSFRYDLIQEFTIHKAL